MALRGTAFLAIWNDIAPDAEAEFNRWHTTEHMPERLWTPGISIGRRYVDPDASHSRYYTMYEATSFEVFASEGYFATGNTPSEWTKVIHPSFLNFSRSPCHTVISRGSGIGGGLATFRLTFPSGAETEDGLTQAEALNVAARGLCDGLLAVTAVTAVHIGLAAPVARRSIRKASLNNRSDIIPFDGVILVEGIGPDELRSSLAQMEEIVARARDCVGSYRSGIYRLAYLLGENKA